MGGVDVSCNASQKNNKSNWGPRSSAATFLHLFEMLITCKYSAHADILNCWGQGCSILLCPTFLPSTRAEMWTRPLFFILDLQRDNYSFLGQLCWRQSGPQMQGCECDPEEKFFPLFSNLIRCTPDPIHPPFAFSLSLIALLDLCKCMSVVAMMGQMPGGHNITNCGQFWW